MQRKEIIGGCELWLGDALEILPSLRADMILTDAPYELESGGNTTGEMGGCFARGTYDNSGHIVRCDLDWSDFMPVVFNCLRDPGHAYFMANNRNVQPMLNAAENAGFHFHNLLVWDKINATPNRWYMKNLEFIGFFSKGKAFHISDCSQKQLLRCAQVDLSWSFSLDGKSHPTEKPISLMAEYIRNSSAHGETILDPFMGSGTTLVACAKMGRKGKGIGIELEQKYFDIACRRVENAYKQGDLFITPPEKPVQREIEL